MMVELRLVGVAKNDVQEVITGMSICGAVGGFWLLPC